MSVSSLVSPVTIQTKSEESTFAEQLTHSHLTSSNFDANLLLREHEDATEHLAIRGARDIYYRKAKELGFRARSAFKLLQVDECVSLFNPISINYMQQLASLAEDIQQSSSSPLPSSSSSHSQTAADSVTTPVQRCVDLCAAPGSWSQVLQRVLYNGAEINKYDFTKKKKKVIAIDLQEMAPLEGVEMIKGDITSEAVARQVIDYFHPHKADLVVSDGAPDVTGLHEIDEYMQAQLMFAVLSITTHILRTGGSFCAKIFRADCYALLHDQLSIFFEYVTLIKPASSRAASAEHFVVGLKFRMPEGFKPTFVKPVELKKDSQTSQPVLISAEQKKEKEETGNGLNHLILNYLHCGDLNGHQHVDKWKQQQQQQQQPTTQNNDASTNASSFTRFLKY